MAAKNHTSRGLRVVLFGTPGSGKSSLLGALWQAAQSAENLLGGKIEDASGGLKGLCDYVYEKKPEDNDQDLALYPISVSHDGQALDATLIDCDGEIAQDCLTKSQARLDSKSQGCRALLGADAILLVIDPTAGSAQIDKEFQQFGNFIHLLEKHRSQRNEVVGLPIYLVLTKCDAIAKPTDAGSAWLQKIEEGKKRVDKRFQEFLAKYAYRSELSFGKIDLHVWATSVKRPALADKPKSQEPYGVAELFRRCFDSAREYHHRRQKARSRLNLALFGYASLLSLMACAAAFFFAIRPDVDMTLLISEINDAVPAEKKDWLKEPPPFQERLKKLAQIEENPLFKKLPAEQQQRVKEAQEEIQKYKELWEYMLTVPPTKDALSEADLQRIDERLAALIEKIPQDYRDSEPWEQSKLYRYKDQIAKDVTSFRLAVKEYATWLMNQATELDELDTRCQDLRKGKVAEPGKEKDQIRYRPATEADRKKWLKEVADAAARKFKDPFELIPGTSITYGRVERFQNDDIAKWRNKKNETWTVVNPLREVIEKMNFSL